jgi:hypothetical protein
MAEMMYCAIQVIHYIRSCVGNFVHVVGKSFIALLRFSMI